MQAGAVVTTANAKAGLAVERGPDPDWTATGLGGAGSVGVLTRPHASIANAWHVKWPQATSDSNLESKFHYYTCGTIGRRDLVVRPCGSCVALLLDAASATGMCMNMSSTTRTGIQQHVVLIALGTYACVPA